MPFPLGPTEVSAALVVLGSPRRHVATFLFASQGTKISQSADGGFTHATPMSYET